MPEYVRKLLVISGKWLSMVQTSKVDVRQMDSGNCPYTGHQLLMSRIWTVKTVHLPDIEHLCLEYRQVFCPCSRYPCYRHRYPFSGHHCPSSGHQFHEKIDIWNINCKNSSCSRHQRLISGIWTVETFYVPDIIF